MPEYEGKVILAPMVRVGTLPSRLLCLRYGADLVYGEEIIDFRILSSTRVENKRLGTIDFVGKDGRLVFRTCEEEKSRVVFQMGTSDPERAAQVGKMVENDVAAIDVNMGCPKPFSIQGGMGAALLNDPDKIERILTRLVESVKIPVTCKIRILPSLEDTIALVKRIEKTGVKALGVHGRYANQRSSEAAHYHIIQKIREAVQLPVIANGGSLDVKCYDDIEGFKKASGCSSVMLGRAAMWNFSVFRKEGLMPIESVVREYLEVCLKYAIDTVDNEGNTKYVVTRMQHADHTSPPMKATYAALSLADICEAWGLKEQYEAASKAYQATMEVRKRPLESAEEEGGEVHHDKKKKLVKEMEVRVDHKSLRAATAKLTLAQHCQKQKWETPAYVTEENDQARLFRATVEVNGQRFRSSLFLNSKKYAEQAAAVVALFCLGIPFEAPKELLALRDTPQIDVAA